MSKPKNKAPRVTGPDGQVLVPIQSNVYRSLSERAAILLARGSTIKGAAATCGIGRETLTGWLHDAHFQTLLESKKEEWREELLGQIQKAGKNNHLWAANAWLLERSKIFKGEYDPPHVREARGQTGNITVQIAVMSPRQSENIDAEVKIVNNGETIKPTLP